MLASVVNMSLTTMITSPICYKKMTCFCVALSLALAGMSMGATDAVDILCPVVKKAGKKAGKGEKRMSTLRKQLDAIAKGADINAVDKNGQTVLMHAASLGNNLAVCWLVAKGADARIKSKLGKTAADYAKSADMQELLNACAKWEKKKSSRGPSSVPYMHFDVGSYASFLEYCEDFSDAAKTLLLPRRSDRCSYLGHIAMLVRVGYDVNSRTENGDSGIGPAMDADIVKLLLALGMKTEGMSNHSRLMLAMLQGDAKVAKELLDAHPELAKQGLHYMFAARTAEVAQLLIAAGFDVKQAESVLYGLGSGGPGMFTPEVLQVILKATEGNRTIKDDDSPINGKHFLGARSGETVELLLKAGFNRPEDIDQAAKAAVFRRDVPVLRALVAAGADVKKPEYLMVAFERPYPDDTDMGPGLSTSDVISFLLEQGIDVNSTFTFTGRYRNEKAREVPIMTGILDKCSKWGNKDNADVIRMLIKAGAKVPKDALVIMGYDDDESDMSLLMRCEIARDLLKAGADINAQDGRGNTFLMHACGKYASWDSEVTKLMNTIIDKNAKLDIRNEFGRTALDLARERQKEEAIKFLEAHGAK